MRQPESVPLGAPGVYVVPARPAPPRLGVPMDECAFVGVSPRGPAWQLVEGDDGPERVQAGAVAVRNWDDYRRVFGGFEGPGLLPLAVSAFFEQGGRVAHVVRVVSRERGPSPNHAPLGRATLRFSRRARTTSNGIVRLVARNEGTWGARLGARLSFSTAVLPIAPTRVAGRELVTGAAPLAGGAVLRVTTADGAVRLRVVESSLRRLDRERPWIALLDLGVPGEVRRVELVEATLEVVDGDPAFVRRERFEHLGLMPAHRRWAGEVLQRDSQLVELAIPDGDGLRPAPELRAASATARRRSANDRYDLVDSDDVIHAGVAAALAVRDAALLCVPDLYAPASLVPPPDVQPPVMLAGAEFDECHPLRARRRASSAPGPELRRLRLDPSDARDLVEIVDRQTAVVATAEAERVVVLLDVPPGSFTAVQRWRRRFASSYAAAYHPWVLVPRDGVRGRAPLVAAPPSAVAAGIIARSELRWGLAKGPANELAKDVPGVTARVPEAEHGELHWSGVNVFVAGPRGVELTGARTLSAERMWRQLTVRRVVSMVERAVARQLQWIAFEPNTPTTRTLVTTAVETMLFDLHRAGVFRGATPAESFFVRTSAGRALARELDASELLCEIGLAPAEPMEFLLVRVYHEADGTLRTESRRA